MPTERGTYFPKMFALQIGDKEVLHPWSTKCTVRWENHPLSLRVFNQHGPLTARIDLNDLVGRSKSCTDNAGRQGNVQITIDIKGHPIRNRRKVFRVHFWFAKRAIFLN